MTSGSAADRAPSATRLVTRVLATSFATVAAVLATVFLVVSLETRARVRDAVADKVESSQQIFRRLEAQRQRDLVTTVSTLAENPTLKAAVDTYGMEVRHGTPMQGAALIATVQRELDKIAARFAADVIAVADANGRVVASTGRGAADWPRGMVSASAQNRELPHGTEWLAVLDGGAYRMLTVPLMLDEVAIGSLEVGLVLDSRYAEELAALARAQSAILVGDRLLATTLDPASREALRGDVGQLGPGTSTIMLGGETWLARQMASVGPATLYTLVSLDQEAASATRAALSALALIAVGALVLAGLGSWWLARTLSGPVDRLSTTLATMAATGQFDAALAPTGTSREVDTLIGAFNEMMSAIARADAATEASYLGAIRALAAALDARDPYTSGHSERVSAISVEMGRTMGLSDSDLEVLRLGALLHDIGKIGVPDHILRKPAPLTTDELECIKTHPLIGAKIVRSIPLLAQHLPIVELHHERPDGQGYPFGLRGDAIPVVARITHVADAYDAMTSARAYRPARPSHEAVAELTRHQGTGFDPDAVTALIAALPALSDVPSSLEANVFRWSWPSRARSLAS